MSSYFYVIMPISADHDFQKKRNIIDKIAKQYGQKPHFPFESITERKKDASVDMKDAAFVFADLSFERPSCYYELGIALGLGTYTFLVAKDGTYIHQIHGNVRYYKDLESYELLVREATNKKVP